MRLFRFNNQYCSELIQTSYVYTEIFKLHILKKKQHLSFMV